MAALAFKRNPLCRTLMLPNCTPPTLLPANPCPSPQSAKDLGCEEATVNFCLPLGTTVNMNGTALYEATTAIFVAQAHGVHLGPADLLVVALTASLAAVGAPAIPSAGLVTMLVVLQAVSLGQYASGGCCRCCCSRAGCFS